MAKDKPTEAPKPTDWTLEELPAVVEVAEGAAASASQALEAVRSFEARLVAAEKLLVNVSPENQILPHEIVNGLEPAQIFSVALNAAITASLLAIPTLHSQPLANKRVQVRNAVDYANLVLAEMLSRCPAKRKVS